MFQDLKNKAYAVSFKAGSIGKGGHKGERGSSGRGGGATAGPIHTGNVYLSSTRMTANVSLQTFRHVFINDQRENKMVIHSATEPENTKPKSDMNLGRYRQIIKIAFFPCEVRSPKKSHLTP